MMKKLALPFLFVIVWVVPQAQAEMKLDQAKIEQLTGLKGKFNEKENVFKVSYPRSDLQVTIAGVKATPPMGLTAWAAFKPMNNQVMVMGDMVLIESEVNPVMSVALDNGLEVTALHNHFFGDEPKVMFMHIGGMGDHDKMAAAVGKVFAAIKNRGKRLMIPEVQIDPAASTLDPKKIDAILKAPGELNQGVYKVTIGRKTKMSGQDTGNAMGVNTWAAFIGSDDVAVVDGDFAMYTSEVQNVLKALRKANINIVAIHHHMIDEEPRIVFLHFWGVGHAERLAAGLRSALDTQKL
jgi:hypothetical protein